MDERRKGVLFFIITMVIFLGGLVIQWLFMGGP